MRDRGEKMFERAVRAIYPKDFASEFAGEMAGVFADGYADARSHGRLRALRFLIRELASLASGALVAHADDRSLRATRSGRAVSTLARILDSPWAPALLAIAASIGLGAIAGELVTARGLYWRATQLALVALLAGVAMRAGISIARDPRAIARSVSILGGALIAALGLVSVAALDETVSLTAALAGSSAFDASLPGIHMRVATGSAALAGNGEPPAGFRPTRRRSMSVERDGLAVRTQLFARGVDLAYPLVAMALLGLGAAGGFRIERNRRRIA